jgi:hypothetical protein
MISMESGRSPKIITTVISGTKVASVGLTVVDGRELRRDPGSYVYEKQLLHGSR